MRETLFILGILAVLVILTAIKYRKQIAGAIGFARAINDIRAARPITGEKPAGTLVQCEDCGVRIPESNAVSLGAGRYRCSRGCVKVGGG